MSDALHTYTCCYMETEELSSACNQSAEYEIISGPSPDDVTYSCDLHVWKLIMDAPKEWWIGSLVDAAAFKLVREDR